MVEQLSWTEVLPKLSYAQVEKIVKEMLRGYHLLEGKIKIRERQALGKGLDFRFDVDTSQPLYREDKLQPLHAKLRSLPEDHYLTKNEQALAKVAREYLDHLPLGTKSQLFAVKEEAYFSRVPEDKKSLKTIADKIERVVDARGNYRDSVDDKAIRRAHARNIAETEAEDLREQKELIEGVLEYLGSYKPYHEKLLRERYIMNKPVTEVIETLNISDRTYLRRKMEAISEFAMLAGIS